MSDDEYHGRGSDRSTSVERRSLLKLLAGGVGVAAVGGVGGGQTTDDGVATGPTLYRNGTAIDLETGAEVWSVDEFDPSAFTGWPIVADGTLYVATSKRDDPNQPLPKDAGIAAIDAATGDLDWRFVPPETDDLDSPHLRSPTVVDGTVYATIETAPSEEDDPVTLFALDAAAGDEVWRRSVPRTFTPVVTNGTIYGSSRTVYGHESTLRAVDAETGDRKWVYEPNGFEVATRPMASADTVFVGVEPDGDERSRLHALDAETGELDWAFTVESSGSPGPFMQPVIADGTVLFGVSNADRHADEVNRLYAIDVESGEERWRWFQDTVIGTGESIRNPPIVADGTVFVVTEADDLFALDLDTGEERWGTLANQTRFTVYDGRIYITSSAGFGGVPGLYTISTQTGEALPSSIPASGLPTIVDDPAGHSVDAAARLGLFGHGDAFAGTADTCDEPADDGDGTEEDDSEGPVAIETREAIDVGTTTATLRGEVIALAANEEATVSFECGEVGTEMDEVSGADAVEGPTLCARTVDALEPGTTYRFRAVAEAACETAEGAVESFTTRDEPSAITYC